MQTRSQSHLYLQDGLPEIPAELLHLAQQHFATGWSGKIVRGTYEGQNIVVKLARIGFDCAEALMREVSAYHMLKEFWGKYVPQLVSYGTTVGGTIMYIAMEEFNGYEIGMGPLSQEVVEEIFDALAAVHQCGILHGDIRPSNIMVAQGQQACVRFLDFGFACFGTSEEGCKREYAQLESLLSSR